MSELMKRAEHVRNVLSLTILEAHRYQPSPDWRTISREEYISQYLIFDLSFPRIYGKSTVVNEIENALFNIGDKKVLFADAREFGECYRGLRRPFGDEVEIIVVEETFDSRHIKMIAENWLLFGYDTYPKIIVVRTKKFVEDYKWG